MPVNCQIESSDGKFIISLSALTVDGVVGNLKAHNWTIKQHKFEHLRKIPLPSFKGKLTVELLIGLDHCNLHFSKQDLQEAEEHIVQLTPLGWTCVGPMRQCLSAIRSFFISKVELDLAMCCMREVELADKTTALSPSE